jgi:hypothetical protein
MSAGHVGGGHHYGQALVFDQALTKTVTNTYCAVLQSVGVWGTTMGKAGFSADTHFAMSDQTLTRCLIFPTVYVCRSWGGGAPPSARTVL